MTTPTSDPYDEADARRFQLAIWPGIAARPWHAEVCADGEARPLRFENPMDLLSFLSRPSGTPTTTRGLR
jgi:hypothetical protein